MQSFFILIFFASVISLVVGLVKPSLFTRIKLPPSRKKLASVFGLLSLFSLIMIGAVAPKSGEKAESPVVIQENKASANSSTGQIKNVEAPIVQTTRPVAEAQKELDDFIDLTKRAGLVDSYEFSKTASVVYIGPVWYSQKVTFKKDFVAKIAMLKKEITGYSHFEVRDAQSNEKVAEVTAFSSSIEIYK